MNQELLDKLFGFCYAGTADSHEAEELCSDIIFALEKSAQKAVGWHSKSKETIKYWKSH